MAHREGRSRRGKAGRITYLGAPKLFLSAKFGALRIMVVIMVAMDQDTNFSLG